MGGIAAKIQSRHTADPVNAQSQTPAGSLPGKEELLSFQGRRMRPAGYAALAGALVVAASIVLQRIGLHLPNGDSDADQLVFEHAHHTRLIYTSILQGLGFCLFAIPLHFLFRSASGRAERVRKAFVGLIILGPLAFGIGLAISAVGSSKAADDFTKQEPAVVQQARQQAVRAQAAAAATRAKGQSKQSAPQRAATTPSTTGSTGSATGSTTTTPTQAARPTPNTPDEAAHDAREGLADHVNRHTTLLIAGGVISTIGVLALVFGMVYTNLWCMRLGLFTRFWGALGMAFGLFLIIPLFPPIPGLVLWFAITGLMLIGRWLRPLPPAWAAGEAMPWMSPRDDPGPPSAERESGGPGGTVEGSGREVAEPPLPGDGGQNGDPPEPPYGESQGQRRKKRKRRR
jgi:hypothetical protein